MIKTPSEDLQERVLQAKDIKAFLKDNPAKFSMAGLPEYLAQMLKEKGLSKAEVAKRSNMEVSYVYHIFDGRKKPQRPKLLALAFAMEFTLLETQRMLRYADRPKLYSHDPWDAVIMHALELQYTLTDVNELLEELSLGKLLE